MSLCTDLLNTVFITKVFNTRLLKHLKKLRFKKPCVEIKSMTFSKNELLYHPKTYLICDQCYMSFSSRYDLKTHIRWVHNDPVLRCDQCEYKTIWNDNFKRHKKLGHGS